MILSTLFAAVFLAQAAGNPAAARADAPLVILSDTGATRDGLPVVTVHPEPARHAAVLTRGYSRRVLRLYALVQRFVRPDAAPQPAYLVLSDNQGGFPRFGMFLDRPLPEAAYIDLHRRSDLSGRAGAMDQIFPHELLHVIVRDLAGDPAEGHATQVHAIGVRTDRVTAFNEGFAEHGQVMAIDDPDAVPETRAVATDMATRAWAFDNLAGYRRALTARWSLAPKHRMTFPFWFSQSEQVLRYHAVRENLFAREPDVPQRLFDDRGAYRAYLLENVLPGSAGAAPKSAARMLATEGVVSVLFYRIVTSATIQQRYREPEFYAGFGAMRDDVDPLDNAYLKVFASIREGGYDTLRVVRALQTQFPDDAASVERIVRETLLDQPFPSAEELWMKNERFRAGRSLFDQFRGAPAVQAFDLNACSAADLAAVSGLEPAVAAAILHSGPFHDVEDLRRVAGVTDAVLATFHEMRRAMISPPLKGTDREGGFSFRAILMPYAWRALYVWIGCALVAGALYRAARRVRWWRLPLNGPAAALVGLLAGWTVDPGTGVWAFAAPVVVFGLPGALIRLWRTRSPREAALVIGAWAAAALPAALAVMPIG